MRVAQITPTFPPYYAGTGNVCYHNARDLARRGHDVTVFTAAPATTAASEPCPGVNVVHPWCPVRLGNAPLLPGLLRVANFDIVHIHLPFIFGAELVWLNSLGRRFRYVVTFHNLLIGYSYRQPFFSFYDRVVTPLLVSRARRFIVSSLSYLRTTPLASLASKSGFVTELTPGVDTTCFRPTDDYSRTRQGLDLEDVEHLVLFVAALDRAHTYKGLEVLLRAMLRPELEAATCIVVGDGDMRAHYELLAGQLGIAHRVRFLGALGPSYLAKIYNIAGCLVMPSLTMESFGLVVAEAWACGRPVVAANTGLVTDGVDGFVVQPGDSEALANRISTLLTDHELAREMGSRGRAKVEGSYTWPAIGRQLEEIYNEVMAAP